MNNPAHKEDSIKLFYETFPLPPPLDNIPDGYFKGMMGPEGCPSWLFHVFWPTKERTANLDILIAGCGTSQACIHAACLPDAHITAIDVSEHSLTHSKKLANQYNLKNIDHRLVRIEDIATLNKKFDLVISSGVLHHLESPKAGLAALKNVLKPDGSIYLMLYGQYGRTGVYIMQDMFRHMGVTPATASEDDVREVGKIVTQLPKKHPFALSPYGNIDGQCIPDVADLFINPRDKSYTVPEIYDLLGAAGMRMQQWIYRSNYSLRNPGIANSAFAKNINSLPERNQFAIGELYNGNIARHCFVCCADERDGATTDVVLDDNWKNLVPILNRMIAVKDKEAPDGRSQWISLPHYSFQGLRVDFTLPESHIINAFDGTRTIAEIEVFLRSANIQGFEGVTKDFIKYLYDYDLIWFRKHA